MDENNQSTAGQMQGGPAAPHEATFSPVSKAPKSKGWLYSSVYLPEYFVALFALATVTGSIALLVDLGIKYMFADTAALSQGIGGAIDVLQLNWALASLVVALPVFVFLYMRLMNREKQDPGVVTHRWRKGFLGIFVVLEVLSVIGGFIGLFLSIFSRYITVSGGSDQYYTTSVSVTGPQEDIWRMILAAVLTGAITLFVAYVVARRYQEGK